MAKRPWYYGRSIYAGLKCITITTITLLMLSDITTTESIATTTNNDTSRHQNVNPVLTVSPPDLHINIDSADGILIINSSRPLQEPIDIYLHNDDTRVATVKQTVTLTEGSTGVSVLVKPVDLGSCTITVNATNFYKYTQHNESSSSLFMRIHVSRSYMVSLLSLVAGWFYMICWAVILLPQIHLNYLHKSVVGLSFDYVLFSVLSYIAFTAYNLMNFWSDEIREAYLNDAPMAPGVDLVSVKDVVFTIFNLVAISVMCLQCFKYESITGGKTVMQRQNRTQQLVNHIDMDEQRGDQKISIISKILIGVVKTIILVLLIIVLAWNENAISWDGFIDALVLLKLFVTFAKYVPQVYMNYSRKSTEGWSIAFAILDFLCGILLLLEMLLVSYNYGNWIAFKHSPTRLCISLFSMLFATIFIVQHYFLYRLIMDEDTVPILGSGVNNKSIQEMENGGHLISSASDKEMRTLSSKE